MDGIITTIIDLIFVLLLMWRIKPLHFRELKWILVATAVILWSIFAILLVSVFWDTYYQYFYPSWFRLGGTLLFVPLLFGILALAFYWLALRISGNPIVIFCLLGGAQSLISHLWGIYVFKILEIPMLQGASPASILAFAFPEYVFYWCVVISIAALIQNSWRWWMKQRQARTRIA